ncbi:hypothetical protein BST95_07420 [Halioglobus japonicus]|uniref:Flagellar assembly protein FliH n=1 Tax=Halioglobus japonicus TaxID=930805 RepID=A0AAP8SNH0_9GAMM|nr:FliH/SctL family protein [Halioglobus japonicus]AQA18096.1 hypothetical protein BST95_07420 [Halioglobus japonicus]PLW86088.1 hypothetical protein C0029_06465 [Halioglobus japonicus]GHD14537.1 hypothetical protein GCM10007052_18370 [Halioglobus japonicus]
MSELNERTELLTASAPWQHWEMELLDPPRGTNDSLARPEEPAAEAAIETAKTDDEPSADDAAILEKNRLEAKAKGYEEGYHMARDDGYAVGFKEGMAAAEQELERLRQSVFGPLQTMRDEYRNALDTASASISNELIELSLAIGNHMALDCIALNPETIRRCVEGLLQENLHLGGDIEITMNPDDVEIINTHCADELKARSWEIRPSRAVSRGGCIVRTADTVIDASLESRLQQIFTKVRQRADQGVS